jgi:hypothetical protein
MRSAVLVIAALLAIAAMLVSALTSLFSHRLFHKVELLSKEPHALPEPSDALESDFFEENREAGIVSMALYSVLSKGEVGSDD